MKKMKNLKLMKRMISTMLAMVLLLGAAWAEDVVLDEGAPAAGERLGFELLNKLYVEGENCVLSPGSLAIALGMAQEGARGETLEQLIAALGTEKFDPAGLIPEGVISANAVFTAEGLPMEQGFIDALNEKYGAEWFKIDGQTAEKVNGWVAEKTNGLIGQLMGEEPKADTGMLLINALAMEAVWANPFAESGTVEEVFHTANGDVNVQMMHQTDRFMYAEKDGAQIICLPYADSSLEMWIALPAPEDTEGMQMAELLENLAGEGSFYIRGEVADTKVELALPKLDIEMSVSLKDALVSLGMSLPFSTEADFSGISGTPLYMDEVMQKLRVQLDEAGTKAAAATVITMPMMAMPGMQDEPAVMDVNRPFVLALTDRESGAVCFAGVVENPAA